MNKYKRVPKGLKNRRIWLLWRNEKDRKVPYYVNGSRRSGALDEPEDRKQLATFEDALAKLERRRGRSNAYSGLGIALGKEDGGKVLSGIDLDDCVDETGEITPLANEVLKASDDTYCEVSPSGRGLKLFGIGDIGTLTDHKNGIEIYSGKRFFTVTGRAFCSICRVLRRLKNAAQIARSRSSKKEDAGTPGVKAAELPKVGLRVSKGGRNDYISKEAFKLKKAGHDQNVILAVVHAMNSAVCDPPLDKSEVEDCVRGKSKVKPDERSTVHCLENFYAYNPTRKYICVLDNRMWVAPTIDSALPLVDLPGSDGKKMVASRWLDKYRAVQSIIWAPGLPPIIEGKLPAPDGLGWRDNRDARCFNNYVPPPKFKGDKKKIGPWLDHLKRLYPGDWKHILDWMAHRVQKPGEKINHALVLGGAPGIGKDTILWPLRVAIGESNWQDITPRHIFHDFNAFVKSVVLSIGEARDLGESNRFAFYEHMKPLLAAPPDAFLCNEKHIPQYVVANVCGVVITTNHLISGMYLPVDDRRHYVAWSAAKAGDAGFKAKDFTVLWDWYTKSKGAVNVATYLRKRDLNKFNAKAAPLKTDAFYQMVDSHRAAEDPMVATAIEKLGSPDALTLTMLNEVAKRDHDAYMLMKDLTSSRHIQHVLLQMGYERMRNPNSRQGLWKFGDARIAVYVHERVLSPEERVQAVKKLKDKYDE